MPFELFAADEMADKTCSLFAAARTFLKCGTFTFTSSTVEVFDDASAFDTDVPILFRAAGQGTLLPLESLPCGGCCCSGACSALR